MADLTSLINAFKQAQAQANQANQQRYDQLMEMYGGEDTSLSDLVQQFSQGAQRRIATNTAKRTQQSMSDLTARGLGVSSVMDSVKQGYQRDAQTQQTAVDEAATRQTASGMMGKIAAITNRTDAQPNMGMFASLLAAASNNGGSMVYAPQQSSRSVGLQNAVNSFRQNLGLTPIQY